MTLGCFNVLHEQNVPLIAHCFGLDIEKNCHKSEIDRKLLLVPVLHIEGEMIYEIFSRVKILQSFVSYEIDIFKVKILNITFKNI